MRHLNGWETYAARCSAVSGGGPAYGGDKWKEGSREGPQARGKGTVGAQQGGVGQCGAMGSAPNTFEATTKRHQTTKHAAVRGSFEATTKRHQTRCGSCAAAGGPGVRRRRRRTGRRWGARMAAGKHRSSTPRRDGAVGDSRLLIGSACYADSAPRVSAGRHSNDSPV